jgi:N,N'-diacetyllegionaminate synthase
MLFESITPISPPIIAEIGLAHDGSLGQALAFIDAAAQSGVEIVKFQIHFGENESTRQETFRVQFSKQDKTRSDYWNRTSFSEEQWDIVKRHCESRGVLFTSSIFSIRALRLLFKLKVDLIKIGSGDLLNEEFAEALSDYPGFVLLSTGLATYSDIESALKIYDSNRQRGKLVLMQCTSKYPTPLAESGVNDIKNLEEMFKIPFGYSDHTRGLSSAKISIVQGAKVIEKHVNFDLRMFGPDSSSSITFDELEDLVRFRNDFRLINTPYNKDEVSKQLESVKKLFGRSVALKQDLKKGHILVKDDLTLKKPDGGEFSWKDLDKIIGRKLNKDLTSDVFLTNGDLG